MTHSIVSARKCLLTLALSVLAPFFSNALHSQTATSALDGSVVNAGKSVPQAVVTIKNDVTGASKTVRSNGSGFYSVDGLPAGTYTVNAIASGFAPVSKPGVLLVAGQTQHAGLTLSVSSVAEEIIVNAGIDSVAAQAAPSGGFIEERTPQSLISNTYIENFTNPIADFGEIV